MECSGVDFSEVACTVRAQLLLTVTFSKKQTNRKKNDDYCSDAVFL